MYKQAVLNSKIPFYSRRGEPELFSQYGKPDWADKVKRETSIQHGQADSFLIQVQWASGNSLDPETYRDLLKGVTNVVHSVGILMENDYKGIAQAQTLCEAARGVPRMILGMHDHGNPLDPKLNDRPRPTYEMMNRDTGKWLKYGKKDTK